MSGRLRVTCGVLGALASAACSEQAPHADAMGVDVRGDPTALGDAAALDAHGTASVDAWHALAADASHGLLSGLAPSRGEPTIEEGSIAQTVTPEAPLFVRVDALPDEHITFFATFDGGRTDVVLEVERWDGTEAALLGRTDAGPGLRTLAVFDSAGPRTFWARIRAARSLRVELQVTRVPFEDGRRCLDDCARLLQLPLPNDPRGDGYDTRPTTVFRYQYGRRDLLMFLRSAARRTVELGLAPLIPEDLSQWDGATPGADRGAPRHASHQRGKDVDVSLHGLDGRNEWRSYCEARATSDGRECVSGSITNYDGGANAAWFAELFRSERVTLCFLDQELIPATERGAREASRVGALAPELLGHFATGEHLRHWPNHDNHIHIRVSEAEGRVAVALEEFEAP